MYLLKLLLYPDIYLVVVRSFSHVQHFATYGLKHGRLSCSSPSPWVFSNLSPLNPWCHPNISSSVIPFSCLQFFPASRSFPKRWLFPTGGQSIGASVSSSALSVKIQVWFPLELKSLIYLLSKGCSSTTRFLSSTTVRRHQFSGAQPFFIIQL